MAADLARSTPPQTEAPSRVRHYLELVARHKVLTLACIVIPTIVAFGLTSRQVKKYSASAQVQVARQNLAFALTGTPDPVASTNDFTAVLETEAALAQSAEIDRTLPENISDDDILGNGSVTPSTIADVLDFSVTAHDPETAVRQTNAYATAYVKLRRQLDARALQAALATARRKLKAEQKRDDGSALADDLTRRVQQLQTLQALQTPGASFIGPATDASKTAPKPLKAAILGLIIGLALAGIVLAALDAVDRRVRSVLDVERRLRLPVFGRLRAVRGKARSAAQRQETLNLLRARLDLLDPDQPTRIVVLARVGDPNVGGPVAADLAATYARAGRRTALIQFVGDDPASPVEVPPAVPEPVQAGAGGEILEARSSTEPLQIVEQSTDADGAVIVSARRDDPAGRSAERVRELVDRVSQGFDAVVVDAPTPRSPLGVAALSSRADAAVFVVAVPDVTRDDLEQLDEALPSFNARSLGILVVERGRGRLPRRTSS